MGRSRRRDFRACDGRGKSDWPKDNLSSCDEVRGKAQPGSDACKELRQKLKQGWSEGCCYKAESQPSYVLEAHVHAFQLFIQPITHLLLLFDIALRGLSHLSDDGRVGLDENCHEAGLDEKVSPPCNINPSASNSSNRDAIGILNQLVHEQQAVEEKDFPDALNVAVRYSASPIGRERILGHHLIKEVSDLEQLFTMSQEEKYCQDAPAQPVVS